jgi:Ca-activated chloride channel family protein
MSFDPNDPRITAYVFGELDAEQRAVFESELNQSPDLRREVGDTQDVLQRLSRELQAEPTLALSDAQRASLAHQIQGTDCDTNKGPPSTTDPAAGSQRWLTGRSIAALIAIAASWLVVGTLAYHYYQRETVSGDRPVAAVSETDHRAPKSGKFWVPAPGGGGTYYGDESGSNAPGRVDTAAVRPKDVPESLGTPGDQTTSLAIQPQGHIVSSAEDHATRLWSANANQSGQAASSPPPAVDPSGSAGNEYGAYGSGSGAAGPAAGGYGSEYGAASGMASGYVRTKGQSAARGTASTPQPGMDGAAYGDHDALRTAMPYPPTMDSYGYDSGYGQSGGYEGESAGSDGERYGEGYKPRLLVGPDGGSGPGQAGDRYQRIVENPFQSVKDHPLSTFSIDVDTASYSKVRMYLMQHHTLPRPDAVRIEELVNYFTYDYQPPQDEVPFAAHIEIADCPWTPAHRLVRFGIKGREMERDGRPTSNLVFLLDVSGSMNQPNKLPLVKSGMKMLVDQLGENDRVAMAVYAGAAGLVLPSTGGDQKQTVLDALDRLHAGGSTNGGQGILLAYQTALDNFVQGGVNRVILCTDGDFNVGVTGTDQLVRIAEEHAKTGIFLSVLGFGMGNHNDDMLEQISNKGNGNYAFIDTESEARKVLVEQMTGTLVTIAKDVKIQVEFNPAEVAAYRLIGYENRILAAEDFNDDTKDAGEIGAGHTVTALYEVVPAGGEADVSTPPVDDLRYQSATKLSKAAKAGELLTLKIRYKQPDGDTSSLLTFPTEDKGTKFGQASQDFRFAAAVASFGMLLRDSQYKGNATFAGVLETATEAASGDTSGYRAEFLEMIERARQIAGQ